MRAPDLRAPSADEASGRRAHRAFLDAYYGATRSIYDVTRAPYLLGRDRALRTLVRQRWRTLVEIGCGTGRNLVALHERRPGRRYGGVEPCAPMREHARARAPFATIADGFAEDANLATLFGRPPDRILFSYSLSMVGDPDRALAHAQRSVAEGGLVVVVDFGELDGLPRLLRALLRRWLETFHVHPIPRSLFERHGAEIVDGPLGYYRIAMIRRRPSR